jgi:hypothetical protein
MSTARRQLFCPPKGFFDICDAQFNDSSFLEVVRRTCIDPEVVSLGKRGVRTLDLRPVHARFRDRALRVINDHAAWAAGKRFERSPVTGQSGFNRLAQHDLGILIPQPCQRRNEDPRLERDTGFVCEHEPRAEVDLRSIPVQTQGSSSP